MFDVENIDDTILERISRMDIHPTGVLWGRGRSHAQSECLALEQQILVDWQDWQQGLEKAGLSQERRALRLYPSDFDWQFLDENQLELSFSLPAGCYATSVMRELAMITDKSQRNYQEKKTISDSNETEAKGD